MTLNKWMGRPQLLPEMFEIVLRPIWCDAGSEQPSPPLHRAAAARLLTGDRHRCSCSVNAAVFVWLTNSHISQFCKIIFLHPLDLHCTALYTNAQWSHFIFLSTSISHIPLPPLLQCSALAVNVWRYRGAEKGDFDQN